MQAVLFHSAADNAGLIWSALVGECIREVLDYKGQVETPKCCVPVGKKVKIVISFPFNQKNPRSKAKKINKIKKEFIISEDRFVDIREAEIRIVKTEGEKREERKKVEEREPGKIMPQFFVWECQTVPGYFSCLCFGKTKPNNFFLLFFCPSFSDQRPKKCQEQKNQQRHTKWG